MKELFGLLDKLGKKMGCSNVPSIQLFSDGSGGISETFGKELFSFDDIKEAIDWLKKETKEDKYFNFDSQFTLDLDKNKPLYIGFAELSNYNEDGLCTLIVNPNYDVEVIPNYYKNKTALKLKRK